MPCQVIYLPRRGYATTATTQSISLSASDVGKAMRLPKILTILTYMKQSRKPAKIIAFDARFSRHRVMTGKFVLLLWARSILRANSFNILFE